MKKHLVSDLWQAQHGLVTAESYSTAWLALVPDTAEPNRPAWPIALQTLRDSQLADGGWGDAAVYYPHDRLISTLAALHTLLTWNHPCDEERIERGVAVLSRYGQDLSQEWLDPIGFELLLPSLVHALEQLGLKLPRESWVDISETTQTKLNLIGNLEADPKKPRTWWFSMEMLPPTHLATFPHAILDSYGAVATSSAATAGYLRAQRLHGRDLRPAAHYLNEVVKATRGGGNVTWPIDVFELAWTLDNLRRAGASPTHPQIAPMIWRLASHWEFPPTGITWNQAFQVQDGDHPAVAYKVLRWAGLSPSDEPLLKFWDEECGVYKTYLDEHGSSISTSIHGLIAFRDNPHNKTHQRIATRLTEWLRQRVMGPEGFRDKWHLSPLYTAARLLPTLIGWDDELARYTLDFILSQQRPDGGWGATIHSNLEETALASLALSEAHMGGLFRANGELRSANRFLADKAHEMPTERLWIGKSLYLPIGVAQGTRYAAEMALARICQ
ncbi:MAG: hypothetical protein IPL28_01370 [Chloroflexi bacterium]|nr:hypothetical protein [Chloroflexota bacterium]